MIMFFVVATQNTNVVLPPSIYQSSNTDNGENSMLSHSTNTVEKELNLNTFVSKISYISLK